MYLENLNKLYGLFGELTKNPVMKAQLLSAVDAEARRLEDEASEAARAALLDSGRRTAALLILGKLTYMQEIRRHLNRPVKE